MYLIAKRYVNQNVDMKPGISKAGKPYSPVDLCGASCGSMVSGDEPNDVAHAIGGSVADTVITGYLEGRWKAECISSGGTKETGYAYAPMTKDFEAIKTALDLGKFVLYHFAGWDGKSKGHYVLCTGYNEETGCFVFSDPAGDRNKGYFGKSNEGENVEYSRALLIKAGIKPLWSLEEL